jgi:phosphocarrier protein HPr
MSGSSELSVFAAALLPAGVDLHARPAGLVVRTAAGLPVNVTLRANGREAKARSILQVLALGATGGTEVGLEASGEGAEEAVATLAGVLSSLT